MLKSESECTITLLVAVITATAMADISYRYLELRLFARRITHLRGVSGHFSVSQSAITVGPSLVVPYAKIHASTEEQQKVVQEGIAAV